MFGISKQAYYKRIESDKVKMQEREFVLNEVDKIRKEMPHTGARKLYRHLLPTLMLNDIKMGRDALFDLLRHSGLLVKKTKRFHITTDSKHFYYTSPNRIKDLEINHSEQVFVSDITYINTDKGHAYLALVTDAYSKKNNGMELR